jgi:HK97 gp10 family phage protein
MANDTVVKVEGLDQVLEAIDNIASGDVIKQRLGLACALVERAAKQKAPKDNGELRRSITSKVEGTTGIVFTPLEYAPYVEYGTGLFAEVAGRKDVPWCYEDEEGVWHSTSGQKPQPFMRPALNDNRTEILKILKGGN